MAEQSQQLPVKKNTAFAFVGGMVIIGVLWFGSSLVSNQLGYRYTESIGNGSGYIGAPTTPSYDSVIGNKGGNSNSGVVGNITQDRKVTKNYLSVHVKSVKQFHADVVSFVESVKGKIMTEYATVSSDNQSESGTMTVLVPNKDAQAFFDKVGERVIKVVDRQVNSYEISQEYTDIERKLTQYEQTYAKILTYYNKANSVTDLLQIQNQLDSVQGQIDALKGRKMALDELSNNTQYTLYSSTNQYNLPYVPQGTFEFAKTFKLAVRSLIATTDQLLVGAIYVLVYVPLLLVFGGVVWVVKKYLLKR